MGLIRRAVSGGSHRRSRSSLPTLGGYGTSAGVSVTPERALQIAAVYACVRALAEDGAGLPLHLLKKEGGGKRVRADDHPTMRLLTYAPNPDIDAAEYWRIITGWQGLRGNAYAYIERDGNGAPKGLWPIAPTSVDVRRIRQSENPARAGRLVYQCNIDKIVEWAPLPDNGLVQADDMLHYRAFGLGMVGLSPVAMARQQIGTSFAAGEYIANFFANDASPGGSLAVPGNLTDDQYERLEAQWRDLHEGVGNSHRLAVLEGGAKWESVSLAPADAMFLDIMKFSRTEIASIYGMPAHRIGDLEHATFSNIEQQSIEYVQYGLMPWLTRNERATAPKLFNDPAYYLKFDPKGLLRGDIAARFAAYGQGRQWGWLSADDIRAAEDEDALPEGGDIYLQPVNMQPAGTVPPVRPA